MSTNPIALEYRDVMKSFGRHVVLDGLSFQLCYGELIGVFGSSGAGKSVILRMTIGLETPDAGHIFHEGQDLSRLHEREFYDIRRRISYVFQSGALFDSLNVEDNLAYPLRLNSDWSERRILDRVNQRLGVAGLEGTNHLYPDELSGGMQTRVGLLRSTMTDPAITLFDEPTSGLDPMNVRAFSQNVLQFKKAGGLTGLFVTHNIHCAFAICDRIAILHEGRIYALDTVDAIQRSRDPVILSFTDMDYTRPEPLDRLQGEDFAHAQPPSP